MSEYEKKLKKLQLLKDKKLLQENLPHIYGHKLYPWMRQYFDSTNKMVIICSANQIGKSSIQIRKAIECATNKTLQKVLWPHIEPRQFWYLYPSSYVATIEFEKKWVTEFMPKAPLQNHPIYGWRADYRSKYIQAVHFNSGVSIYFKTYSQDPQDLQSGTCDFILTDEELPMEIFPELQARLFASDGYFSLVFTPTLSQDFWRQALEGTGKTEKFPDALKLNVSIWDCLKYEDGTNSHWTAERIQKIINSCKSEAEVQRRVYGKFVLDSGLKYQAFNPAVNIIEPQKIPEDWLIYCGVDSGTGGKFNHPSAYVFVAMRPDFQLGWIFAGRRFDGIPTTNSDLVAMVRDRVKEIGRPVTQVFYDYAATDLATIAYQMGETWIPAEKSHMIGEQFVNVGFKNRMLMIFNTEELATLVAEIKSLKLSTPKNQAHDDFTDAMRYAITKVPWDFSCISDKPIVQKEVPLTEVDLRRKFMSATPPEITDIESEFTAWNELLDEYGYN